jgi:hypothetical protein
MNEAKSCNTCSFSCSEKETDICVKGGYSNWEAAKPRFPETVEMASDEVPASESVEPEDSHEALTFGPLETDPNGVDQHTAGAKLDAGKPRMGLVLGGFATALEQVARVGTHGADKYSDNGWRELVNGEDRFLDAALRHILKHLKGEIVDPDFGETHLAHASWNLLAAIEFRENEK